MKYVQFYTKDENNKYQELIGSDGVMRLDGRWNKSSCIRFVYKHPHCKYLIANKDVKGYRIFNSPTERYTDGKPLTKIYSFFMAKPIFKNNHYAIKLTYDDCKKLNFGFQDVNGNFVALICDNCNTEIQEQSEDLYYIPELNRLFCKECGEDWIDNNPVYDEDIKYTKRNYNAIAVKLGLPCV